MELPLSQAPDQTSIGALIRALRRSRRIMADAILPVEPIDAAHVYCSPDHRAIRMVNFAGEVAAGTANDASSLLDAIDARFEQGGSTCHVLEPVAAEAGQPLRDAARARGFESIAKTALQLEDYEPAEPNRDLQILPIRAAMPELPVFYRAMATQGLKLPDEAAHQFAEVMIERLNDPRLELFIARESSGPIGVAGVLSLGEIGVIDPAFVLPAGRGRGAAKALLHHTIDHCARAMFRAVVLARSADCDSIPLYESLGFARAGAFEVLRRFDDDGV